MRRPIAIEEAGIQRGNIRARPAAQAPNYQRSRRRWLVLLLISVIAIVFMAACGFALAALSLLHVIEAYGRLATVGVALIAAAFPTLIFAAHCFDRIDHAVHAIAMENHKQKLLSIIDPSEDGPGVQK
jgi:hypothetical protein